MRSFLVSLIGFLATVGFGLCPVLAKDTAVNDQLAAVDQLAQQIFNEADKNHNHVLNKNEFRNADGLLRDTVEQWGREGLIGKPKKASSKEKEITGQADAVNASGAKLARSNKVSQAEFTFYAQAVVEQADQHWRQALAAAAAQRKAISAQRRAATNRVRRTPYPF